MHCERVFYFDQGKNRVEFVILMILKFLDAKINRLEVQEIQEINLNNEKLMEKCISQKRLGFFNFFSGSHSHYKLTLCNFLDEYTDSTLSR